MTHDHSDEVHQWCTTCNHLHIATIPYVTFECHQCGWGQWTIEEAREHEKKCNGHWTFPVTHVLISTDHHRVEAAASTVEKVNDILEQLSDILGVKKPNEF